MDTIRFQIGKAKDPDRNRTPVDIFVNGRNLLELVREVELPFATEEGHPETAGDYDGLPPEYVFLPSRHFLDKPNGIFWSYAPGWAAIYICKCSEPGCWPLEVKIEFGEDKVVWKDFVQPHRSRPRQRVKVWDYARLGQFVFDRKQYETALAPPGPIPEPTWTELEGIEPQNLPSNAERYWQQFLISLPSGASRPSGAVNTVAFGRTWQDTPALAALVRNGAKTANGSLVWSLEADGSQEAHIGDLRVVLAGPDDPVCIIETTDVRVIPFDEVPASYAKESGQGDGTLADWRRVYWDYIVNECNRIGRTPDPKAPLAMERFRTLYAEPLREDQDVQPP